MGINKVIYGSTVLIDLTDDTVTASDILSGKTAHDHSGTVITGSCDYTANPSDGTAGVAEVLASKTFYAGGSSKKTGEMTNNGAISGAITTVSQEYTVPQGFHDGSGKVKIDATEQAKIIAGNIKKDIVILGVTGTYAGSSVTAETKTVTPSTSQQTVLPTGADYLSQVTVNAIPYTETSNTYGTTVTIG